MASGTSVVVVTGAASSFAQEIIAGKHRLVSDEPVDMEGTDTGPDNYELLLASLGSCTSMTVAVYARRKQWPLTRVTVNLKHYKIDAADCEECETKQGQIDRIEREVVLEGTLSDEQRTRLLEIANKCPIHKTLRSEINIQTRLSP